jgi:hypothetical protein
MARIQVSGAPRSATMIVAGESTIAGTSAARKVRSTYPEAMLTKLLSST